MKSNLARQWRSPIMTLSDRAKEHIASLEYPLLRSQTWLDEGRRKKDEYLGHRTLALAILVEALFCLAGEPTSLDRDEDLNEERQLAAAWFGKKGDPWEAPSFAWVCMVCGLEPWMIIEAINRIGPSELARKFNRSRFNAQRQLYKLRRNRCMNP